MDKSKTRINAGDKTQLFLEGRKTWDFLGKVEFQLKFEEIQLFLGKLKFSWNSTFPLTYTKQHFIETKQFVQKKQNNYIIEF